MLVESQKIQAAGDTLVEERSQTNTKGDVVILYESNVENDTLSDVTPKPRPPNQYVETIVCEEESDSECSEEETYTKEDLNELCLINSEALDFINNIPSVDAPLCHKQNQIKIKPSGFMTNQLDNLYFNRLNTFSSFGSLLSTSLMDILCSNQKNDNYVCYMDNLISHVQYTIEELKRISNGEYLSERTKQRWVDSAKPICFKAESNKFKKTANNYIVSKPAIVPYKKLNELETHKGLRDVITVRSEINTKLLNKILKKRVVVQVPKVACDSVVLGELAKERFMIESNTDSHNCGTNVSHMIITSYLRYPILTLSCRNFNIAISTQNFNTLSNEKSEKDNNLLAIKYKKSEYNHSEEDESKVIKVEDESREKYTEQNDASENQDCTANSDDNILDKDVDWFKSELNPLIYKESLGSCLESVATLSTGASFLTEKQSVEKYSSTSSSLSYSIQQINSKLYLNIRAAANLTVKKKASPTKLKLKSPYENNSHLLEEKKRKRLLKIRERREKTRKKPSENKESAGNLRSETKLILTGKSVPTSQAKENKKRRKKRKNKFTAVKDTHSYVENRNSLCSDPSTPIAANNFSKCLEPVVSHHDFKTKRNRSPNSAEKDSSREDKILGSIDFQEDDELAKLIRKELYSQDEYILNHNGNENICVQPKFIHNIPPVNTPNESTHESSKASLSKQCKKSINKLYTLIKELENPNGSDKRIPEKENTTVCAKTLTVQSNIKANQKPITKRKLSTTDDNNNGIEELGSKYTKENHKKKIEIVAHMPNVTLTNETETTNCDKTSKNLQKHVHQQQENTLKKSSLILPTFDNVQGYNNSVNANKSPTKTYTTIREIKKNTHEINRENKRDECETINENKKNIRSVVSPKILKSNNIRDHNTNIKDLVTLKGKISCTVNTQTEEQSKIHEERKKEDIPRIVESSEVKDASGDRILGRTRLDALAKPKNSNVILNKRDFKKPINPLAAAGNTSLSRERTNTSFIPQRIKNTISQNTTDIPNKKLSKASPSPRTQDDTEVERQHCNSPERKRLSENKKILQTKNNNVFKTPNFLKKNIEAIHNRAKATSQLLSTKRKKLPEFPTTAITEQDDSANKVSKSEPPAKYIHTDDVTKPIVGDSISIKANYEVNELSVSFKPTKNTAAHLNQSKSDEIVSGSDYKINVLEDGNISTAVANTSARNMTVANSRFLYKKHNFLKSQGRPSFSLTRLEDLLASPMNKIKSACDQNVFKNSSRKQSIQQIFVLQSGDAGSLTMNTSWQNMNNIIPKLSIHTFTKSSIDRTSETLSLHYFPLMHSRKNWKPRKTVKNVQTTQIHKYSPTDSNENVWHDLNKVSKYRQYIKDRDNEMIMEKSLQIGIGLRRVNSLDNSITGTDSVLTYRTYDKTTSMDILVELINEIKTISTYHANMSQEENVKGNTKKDTGVKNLSIPGFGAQRNFDSNSSIHSYFASVEADKDHLKYDNNIQNERKIINVDKEVSSNVDEYTKEVMNRCTDVPSQLFTVTDRAVDVSTSSMSLPVTTAETLTNTETLYCKETKEVNSSNDVKKRDNTDIVIEDQHLELKRDILVTVYSILVLTIFVAMTYPDIVVPLSNLM